MSCEREEDRQREGERATIEEVPEEGVALHRRHRWENAGRWLFESPIDLHATGRSIGGDA